MGCAGITALVGATLTAPASRRYKQGSLLIGAPLLQSIGLGVVPFTGELDMWVIPILILGQIFFSVAVTVYSITQLSLRQAVTPDELLGRVNASWRVLVGGVIPFGAMIGGVLGEIIGLQLTLVVGTLVTFVSFVFHLCSPLQHLTDFQTGTQSQIVTID